MKRVSLFLILNLVFLFSISAQESPSLNNFFIGVGAKGNVFLNQDWNDLDEWIPSFGGDFFVGKWFNSNFGGRISLEGGSLHPLFNDNKFMVHEKYALGRLDLLFNATNFFRSYSPDRVYNLVPYIGVGGATAFNRKLGSYPYGRDIGKEDPYFTYAFGGGLLNTFRLSNVVSAYLNLGLNIVDAKFDGYRTKKFDGIFSASVGLVFNLSKAKPLPEIIPPFIEPPVVVPPKEEPTPPPPTPPAPEPPKPQPPVVEPAPYPYYVFFRLDKWVIDADQEINVVNTAKYMNANPTTKVKVIGYADRKTGNAAYNLKISEKRAKNVAKELVEKYNINSNRIIVEWKGDIEQPFSVNKQNRVVIVLGD